jgi:hypothetical protein
MIRYLSNKSAKKQALKSCSNQRVNTNFKKTAANIDRIFKVGKQKLIFYRKQGKIGN